MILLLDENLSSRLPTLLREIFADVRHVSSVLASEATDFEVWDYALSQGCLIVSKDSDFVYRATLSAQAPKVVWIRIGNCTTQEISNLLEQNFTLIQHFANSQDAILELI